MERKLTFNGSLEPTVAKVILVDDKNNTVHELFMGTLSCNHFPIDEEDYEVADSSSEVTCEGCKYMQDVYERCAEEFAIERDQEILDDISRYLFNRNE